MNLEIAPEPPLKLRVFVLCDQSDTAPIWGYIIREKGLVAIIETSPQRAVMRSTEIVSDLIILDVNAPHAERMELCRQFRAMTDSPILLFLPANNETEILEAYQAGVDECVVKPISPALFVAKIMAWARRGQSEPVSTLSPLGVSGLSLDPSRRMLLDPRDGDVRLTNLEFRLLHLLMRQPGHVFPAEEIMQTVWGSSGQGDLALLKNVVYRLRRKLETEAGNRQFIQTWPGGYSFQV